jgi:hypothetical protein
MLVMFKSLASASPLAPPEASSWSSMTSPNQHQQHQPSARQVNIPRTIHKLLTGLSQWPLQHPINLSRTAYTRHPPSRSSSHSPCPRTHTPSSTYSSPSTQLLSSSSSRRRRQKTALRLHLSDPLYTRCPTATTLPSHSARQSTQSHTRLTSHNVWRSCLREKRDVRATLAIARASGTACRAAPWRRRWRHLEQLSKS